MLIYHYRPIESALLEIEKGTFHFASREELNDPIEGYVRVFWQGDKAAWEGLFRNYICSLSQAIDLYLLRGDEEMLHHETLLVNLHRFDNVPLGGILKSLGDGFLADEEIQKLSAFYGNNRTKVFDGELQMLLHFIHNKALIRCIHNCKDCRTIPEETADSLLNMFITKENSFPFELMEAEFLNDEYRSEIIKKAKEVFEDARDFQYVRLGFEDDTFLYGNHRNENGQISKEKTITEARQRRNWMTIAVDFPKVYIEQLKDMIYPANYVVCFSGRDNDSAMWGNYADHHKGVCLIYETDENNNMAIIKKNSTIHLKVKPVHYEGEMTERNFFETFGRLTFKEIESWLTGVDGVSSVLDTFSDEEEWRKRYWEVFDAKTYRKIKAWEHENEYRLSLYNMFSEYNEPVNRNLKYSPEHFKGLIFGMNISEYDKMRIMEKLLTRADELKEFKFYQAEYDDEKQSISIREKLFWRLDNDK